MMSGWVWGILWWCVLIRALHYWQLLDMAHSPAARLHNSLVQTVQMKWFPAMCNGFVVISSDMSRTLPSPRTRLETNSDV